jgi:hypothetical protein
MTLSPNRPRISFARSLSDFAKWLRDHPVDGDRPYSVWGVHYQASRYCEYLHANPWVGGDPLRDPAARDGAVDAYRAYLATFDAAPATIDAVTASLRHFYTFLGVGIA